MKQHRTLRRGLGLLLGLVMCLTLLTVTALAAEPATATADFTTDANAALALLNAAKTEGAANSTWDSTAKKLTLKGVNFTTSASDAVILPDGAVIELVGDNTITSVSENTGASCGIRAKGSLTIQGSGTLIVTGSEAYQGSKGIYASNDMTISGGTVTATGGEAEYYSCGIYADEGNVDISGGTVTATGGTAGWYSDGISADGGNVIISGGTVTGKGGNVTGEDSESTGIYAYEGDVAISGGTVIATGGEAEYYSCGIYAEEGVVTISGGHVTARTLAGTDATKRMGLNVAPTLSEHTGYNWRTSPENAFTASTTTPYTYDTAHTYFEVITNPFEDVPGGAYYYDAVQWAFVEGITAGTSDTTFSPNAPCTRAQAVTFLWRNAGTPEPTTTNNPFTDVKPDDYYYKAVLWAVENKIVYGIDETTFGPNRVCTRAQVAAFLWRAAGEPEPTTTNNPFHDVDASEYYGKAVIWAAENKIVYGIDETTFGPQGNCTRAQIVAFLYRAYAPK